MKSYACVHCESIFTTEEVQDQCNHFDFDESIATCPCDGIEAPVIPISELILAWHNDALSNGQLELDFE